jgi:hypothetical protein
LRNELQRKVEGLQAGGKEPYMAGTVATVWTSSCGIIDCFVGTLPQILFVEFCLIVKVKIP